MYAGDKEQTLRTCLCGTSWEPDGTYGISDCSAGYATLNRMAAATYSRTSISRKKGWRRMIESVWQAIRWLGMSVCSLTKQGGN